MKVLGPNETGRGILIEYDAGHISPEENKKVIREMKGIDFSDDIVLYELYYRSSTLQIRMGEYTPRDF